MSEAIFTVQISLVWSVHAHKWKKLRIVRIAVADSAQHMGGNVRTGKIYSSVVVQTVSSKDSSVSNRMYITQGCDCIVGRLWVNRTDHHRTGQKCIFSRVWLHNCTIVLSLFSAEFNCTTAPLSCCCQYLLSRLACLDPCTHINQHDACTLRKIGSGMGKQPQQGKLISYNEITTLTICVLLRAVHVTECITCEKRTLARMNVFPAERRHLYAIYWLRSVLVLLH